MKRAHRFYNSRAERIVWLTRQYWNWVVHCSNCTEEAGHCYLYYRSMIIIDNIRQIGHTLELSKKQGTIWHVLISKFKVETFPLLLIETLKMVGLWTQAHLVTFNWASETISRVLNRVTNMASVFCVISWVHLNTQVVEPKKSAATQVEIHGLPVLRQDTQLHSQDSSMWRNFRHINTDSRVGGFILIDMEFTAGEMLIHQLSGLISVDMKLSVEENQFIRMDLSRMKGCPSRGNAPVRKWGGLDSTAHRQPQTNKTSPSCSRECLEWVWAWALQCLPRKQSNELIKL